MPSKGKRQRQGKEREIMECVKDIFLNRIPHPKKAITYQPISDMIHPEAILLFMKRDIIFKAVILMPMIGYFTERYY
jgi:hypothetical protein